VSLYVPAAFSEGDGAAVARLIDEHPFATLVTPVGGEVRVSHVPLLRVADATPNGTLIGHLARANPHWREAAGLPSIAVFHGPHAYVSPSWYEHPEAMVPTWNYATVHAHGIVEVVDDADEVLAMFDAMARRFEGAGTPLPRGRADGRKPDAMAGGIVAIRMRIARLDGKFKLSQNRTAADRRRVIDALARGPHPDAVATAAWMSAYAAPPADDR
jgi:transcriptional regulator